MTPERWRQVTEVFNAALAREAAARGALLDEACAGDPGLRAEVDAMLAAHEEAGGFGDGLALGPLEEAPRLERGAALGPYRIEELIGSGGMGEVYRAHDSRLHRDVAVKVLPVRLASDPRLKQRLDREARALATLSHPHICPVFDIGQQDGVDYLVMEYLDGQTLATRLAKGPLPLPEALRCAVEIADALDKAHRHGVVHRDLKPGNIMLTRSGSKLLDFGLSKLRPASPLASGGAAPLPLTGQGKILGTLQYMSPEQLNGEEADARSDIFAFGAVVYEMATGKKAFEGKTPASMVAAILEHEPPAISTLQPMSPPALDHLVMTCLAKDPDRRWQSTGDIGRYLTGLLGEGSTPRAVMPAQASRGRRTAAWADRIPWLAAAALGILATFIGLKWLTSERVPSPLLQSFLSAPPGVQLDLLRGFALSPDGHRLAFVARDTDGVGRLWLRSLADLQARPLTGTEGARSPFWSPDGRHIAFFADQDQQLKRIPAAGGAVRVLAGPITEPKGGAWSAEGRIVCVPDYRTGLFEVPASGGTLRALTALDAGAGELSHRWPQFLPDGRTVLFLVQTAEGGAKDDQSRIEALGADGTRHEILKVNASAAFAPPGQLLFWREGSIYAQEFDAKRLQLHGDAKLVAEAVDLTINEWATFSVSNQGMLVYASAPPWRLEWRERSGRLLSVAGPTGDYADAALSPDGRRVAYVADNITLWGLDLVRGTNTRLSFDNVDHFSPTWAPHGDWVADATNIRAGGKKGTEIIRRGASGHGEAEVLYSSGSVVRSLSWSPDGRWIAFEESKNVLLLELESRVVRTRISTPAVEGYPRFSPDSRWLAYTSDESGRDEVYVVSALDGPRKWQVSSRGGTEPRWGPVGDELFFLGSDHKLRVVKVHLGKDLEFGLPEPLFHLPAAKYGTTYDVGPDGRILVTAQVMEGGSDSFHLVQNWPRLLEKPLR